MFGSRHTTLLGAGLVLLLGACGEQTSPDGSARSVPLNADIAAAVSHGVGEDVQTMRELGPGLRFGFLFLPLGHAAPPRDCPYDAATGRHVCPEVTMPHGFVLTRSYAFFDAGGQPMEQYDNELTASINLTRGMEGSVSHETEGASFSGSVSHSRDLTVSGLAGIETQRTWNGGGTSAIRRTAVVDGRGTRNYEMDATVSVVNVVVPTRDGEDPDPWPLSGTITHVVTGSVAFNEESRTFERTVVVTFNGTRFADVTVNGESFSIDLATRRAMHRGR